MTDMLTVKATLQHSHGMELGINPIIRRFIMSSDEENVQTVYNRLIDVLPTVFPDTKHQNFDIYWKGNTFCSKIH